MQIVQEFYQKRVQNYDRQDSDQVSLAYRISIDVSTMFHGGGKYIPELFQNAVDKPQYRQNKLIPLKIDMELVETTSGSYLLVQHNGIPFDEDNVRNICSYPSSLKSDKASDSSAIGYKGIGSKTVFTISEEFWILSGQFQFRFDKSYCSKIVKTDINKFPWQITPIESKISELPEGVQKKLQNKEVCFVIKLIDGQEQTVKMDLENFANHPAIVLFLERLDAFTITLDRVTKAFNRTVQPPFTLINGQKWITKKIPVKLDTSAKKLLKSMDDSQCPERLRTADSVNLIYAACFDQQGFKVGGERVLYAGLPSKVKTFDYPLLLNGSFLLKPDRTDLIDQLPWNMFLVEECGRKHTEFLAILNKTDEVRFKVLQLYKSPNSIKDTKHTELYRRGFERGSRETPFLPSFSNEKVLLTFSEAVFDETGFFAAFPAVTPPKKLLHPKVEKHCVEFKNVYGIDELCAELPEIVKNNTNLEFLLGLCRFLTSKPEWQEQLKEVPLFYDRTGSYAKADEIFIKPAEEMGIPQFFQVRYLHPDLASHKEYVKWAKSLGVKKATPISVLRNIRITVTNSNALELVKFLLSIHNQGSFNEDDTNLLQNFSLLNEEGVLKKPHELYLSDLYKPKLSLQSKYGMTSPIFVSTSYAKICDPSEIHKLGELFSLMGVHSKIRSVYNVNKALKELKAVSGSIKNYISDLKIARENEEWKLSHLTYFPILDLECGMEQGKLYYAFWQHIARNWQKKYMGKEVDLKKKTATAKKESFQSYLVWKLNQTPTVLGTDNQLHFPKDLFYRPNPSELSVKWDLNLTLEQAKFFGFKTKFTESSCVSALKTLTNQGRFGREYRDILLQLLELNPKKEDIATEVLKLPSESGIPKSPSDLKFYLTAYNNPSTSGKWLKKFPETTHDQMVQIADLFGVQKVQLSDFKIPPNLPRTPDTSFVKHLLGRLDLICQIEFTLDEFKSKEELMKLLEGKINPISVQNISHLRVEYQGLSENFKVFREGSTFFVSKCWNSGLTLHPFCEELIDYLGLKHISMQNITEILTMDPDELQQRFSDILTTPLPKNEESLKEEVSSDSEDEDYDPKETTTPIKKKDIIPITPPSSGKGKKSAPLDNQTTQDTGWIGERKVFETLKDEAIQRYPNCEESQSVDEKCFKIFKENTVFYALYWPNMNGESKSHYDIKAKEQGKRHYYEVKATKKNTKSDFTMGKEEYNLMHKKKDDYTLYLVTNAAKIESAKIVKIVSAPFKQLQDSQASGFTFQTKALEQPLNKPLFEK